MHDAILVSLRADELPESERTPGYILGECARCHNQIILSPSSQAAVKTKDCLTICMFCLGDTEREDAPRHLELMPGQSSEVISAFRRLINRN